MRTHTATFSIGNIFYKWTPPQFFIDRTNLSNRCALCITAFFIRLHNLLSLLLHLLSKNTIFKNNLFSLSISSNTKATVSRLCHVMPSNRGIEMSLSHQPILNKEVNTVIKGFFFKNVKSMLVLFNLPRRYSHV